MEDIICQSEFKFSTHAGEAVWICIYILLTLEKYTVSHLPYFGHLKKGRQH